MERLDLERHLLGRTGQALFDTGQTGQQRVVPEALPRGLRVVNSDYQPAIVGWPREVQQLALRQGLAVIGMNDLRAFSYCSRVPPWKRWMIPNVAIVIDPPVCLAATRPPTRAAGWHRDRRSGRYAGLWPK